MGKVGLTWCTKLGLKNNEDNEGDYGSAATYISVAAREELEGVGEVFGSRCEVKA